MFYDGSDLNLKLGLLRESSDLVASSCLARLSRDGTQGVEAEANMYTVKIQRRVYTYTYTLYIYIYIVFLCHRSL